MEDYEVQSLPVEVQLEDDNKWEDNSNSADVVDATVSKTNKKYWKVIAPLAIVLVTTGAVVEVLLSRSSNSSEKSMSISLEQMQPTSVADESETTAPNNVKSSKSSKSTKSGRGSIGGETIGGGWELGSMSMSFYFRDSQASMSMSVPPIESLSMSLPSVESMSMSAPSIESLSMGLPSVESMSMSLSSIESMSMSVPSIERLEMSLPSIESLSMSLPSIESSYSLPSIEINSVSLSGNSFVLHSEIGSRPSKVGSKGSKRGGSDFTGGEKAGSLSLSMPFASRFLKFDEYDDTYSIHPQLNDVHDGPVFRRKRYI